MTQLEQIRNFIKAANQKGWLLKEFNIMWQKVFLIKGDKEISLTIWSDTGRIKIIYSDSIQYKEYYTIKEGLELL